MHLTNKKIMVTGGAGFIGSNLVDALIAQNNDVIVVDDFSSGHRSNLDEALATGRLSLVPVSILDTEALIPWLEECDVVFHLAVQCLRKSFDNPELVHDVNATGTLRLLELVQKVRPQIERFIYVSSSEIYGTALQVPMDEAHPCLPTTVYGASKLAGEVYTQAYFNTYKLPVTIIRPFNTYGPREHYEGASGEVIPRFIARILNGKSPVIFGEGNQTRDFTYVADTVRGMIEIAQTDSIVGETVNLAYGQEASIKTVADKLLALLQREDLGITYDSARPADVDRHYAAVDKLLSKTGFKPQTSLDEGLEKTVSWFKAKYQNPALLLEEMPDKNWETTQAQVPA